MKLLKPVFDELKSKLNRGTSSRFNFFEVGFHGDEYLIQIVDSLMQKSRYFIETGTNVGTTLAYVAKKHPDVQCLSCEPDGQAFDHAVKNVESCSNVHIYNEVSQEFIGRLEKDFSYLFEDNCLFWLDAHGYGFDWPLRDEIEFITNNFDSGIILIDDFKVPGEEQFGYDEYDNQICSFEYIQNSINPQLDYGLYYPCYKERTSKHHPLRGWGMISFGVELNPFPERLKESIKKVK